MHAYGKDYAIAYDGREGGWFERSEYTFLATDPSGLPLFKVVSDGKSKAELETFSRSDPVNAMIAAFAVSIKMEPKEFFGVCKEYCHGRISLDSFSGLFSGFGQPDDVFEAACHEKIKASMIHYKQEADAAEKAAAEKEAAEKAAAAALEVHDAEPIVEAEPQYELPYAPGGVVVEEAVAPSDVVVDAEVFIPQAGYSYGVVVDAIPFGEPIEVPEGIPFTVVEDVPTFEPIPMGTAIVTPQIGVEADPIPMAVPIGEPWTQGDNPATAEEAQGGAAE